VQFIPCFGDIEMLPFPADLTLVVSGATFQWLSDPHSFLKRLGNELASGAYLAFSLFGPGTLYEFSSLTEIELEYVSDEALTETLNADFEILHYKKYQDKLLFPTVREILAHIRDTGVGGVSEYKWNKQSLQEFETGYEESFSTEKGLSVSYASSCFIVRRR
jgi:SAM-dependent methyltransferase